MPSINQTTTTAFQPLKQPTDPPWISGAELSVIGNFCISLGFQLQKLAHTHRGGSRPLLRCAVTLMALGEGCNFIAYGMAPASLVAPMDAVAIVSNVIVSRILFRDRLSHAGVVGVVVSTLGILGVALNAPRAAHHPTNSTAAFNPVISYHALAGFVAMGTAVLWAANPFNWSFAVSRHTRLHDPIFLCFTCATMGAFTAVSAKCISSAMHHSLLSRSSAMFDDPSVCWLTYLSAAFCAGSIALQIKYLGIAVGQFGAAVVLTLYYVMFTALAVGAGMVVFEETKYEVGSSIELYTTGLLLIFAGVFIIGRFAQAPLSVHSLEADRRSDKTKDAIAYGEYDVLV